MNARRFRSVLRPVPPRPPRRGRRGGPTARALVAGAALALGAGIAAAAPDSADSAGTTVVREGDRFELHVDGAPFEVRGVGMGRTDEAGIAALAAAGGTAFRTWESRDIEAQLDAAARHGLKVMVGLDTGKALTGFDYADAAAVAEQHARVAAFVDRHAGHPAVLGWIVANEPNLAFDAAGAPAVPDPAVYDALARIVDHVHGVRPRRPATIAFAFTATLEADVRTALERVPALDIVSFQAYGALPAVPDVVERLALDRPFMVTEYGPLGHWEMPATDWGREIEEPSGPKADGLVQRAQVPLFDAPDGRLVGSFAFLWGAKQERTPTWYGLLLDSGERTAGADALQRLWTGAWPANRAPAALALTLDGRAPTASVRLAPGQGASARLDVTDPDGDALRADWTLRTEVIARSAGGQPETTPPERPLRAPRAGSGPGAETLAFDAPAEPGEYRLFVTVRDDRGGAATANFPFLVEAR